MALYQIIDNAPVEWNGEEINEIRYPINIEQLWTSEELAAVGLYEPLPADDVPEGKIIVSTSVQIVDGLPKFVNVISDPPEPDPITVADIDAEKDRRLAMGFSYDFGDERGLHHIGTTKTDMDGWSEVTTWASTKTTLGQNTATTIIQTDTGLAVITPLDWFHILDTASEVREAIWLCDFTLRAMSPIPQDYTDDKYWTPPLQSFGLVKGLIKINKDVPVGKINM